MIVSYQLLFIFVIVFVEVIVIVYGGLDAHNMRDSDIRAMIFKGKRMPVDFIFWIIIMIMGRDILKY